MCSFKNLEKNLKKRVATLYLVKFSKTVQFSKSKEEDYFHSVILKSFFFNLAIGNHYLEIIVNIF